MEDSNFEIELKGVREYGEEDPVYIHWAASQPDMPRDRYVIRATNEGGYNSTAIDFLDLLNWLESPAGVDTIKRVRADCRKT